MFSKPLVSTVSLPTLDVTSSDRLCYSCKELSLSVESLRGSINRYESYKENKKLMSMKDPNDDSRE